ncbi:MAG TPA: hypothetical protein VM512_14330 [Burkholderiaceae bacterium]|nr:hypothetical protein [Burkholderiaceae bacterium]
MLGINSVTGRKYSRTPAPHQAASTGSSSSLAPKKKTAATLSRNKAFYQPQTAHRFVCARASNETLPPHPALPVDDAALPTTAHPERDEARQSITQAAPDDFQEPSLAEVQSFNYLLNLVRFENQEGMPRKYHLARDCAKLFGVEFYPEERMKSPENSRLVAQQFNRRCFLRQCYLDPRLTGLSEGGRNDVLTLLQYARGYLKDLQT